MAGFDANDTKILCEFQFCFVHICTYKVSVAQVVVFLFLVSYFVFVFKFAARLWCDVPCRRRWLYLYFFILHTPLSPTTHRTSGIKWSISILNATELCSDMKALAICVTLSFRSPIYAIVCVCVMVCMCIGRTDESDNDVVWCTCIRPIKSVVNLLIRLVLWRRESVVEWGLLCWCVYQRVRSFVLHWFRLARRLEQQCVRAAEHLFTFVSFECD